MTLNSINTNIAALAAQGNIGRASDASSASISRLSSGNRIVQASDDVAALSVGTSLRTSVTTLKQAQTNTSQGTSLLQVADGALSEITDILQRQKAIAVQASGGSLTDTERSFLNQEFQNLTSELDRLAQETNFNGVSLLNGGLSERVDATANAEAGEQASLDINFSVNPADGEAFTLTDNLSGTSVQITIADAPGANEAQRGATIAQTVGNVADFINNSSDPILSSLNASANGNTLSLTQEGAGTAAQREVVVDLSGAAATSNAIDAANGTGAASITGATGVGAFSNIFDGPITATDANVDVVDAAAADDTPFTAGDINVDDGDGNAEVIYSVGASDTLNDIVDGINSNASTTGISAQLIGSAGAYNVQLSSDSPFFNDNVNTGEPADLTIAGAGVAGGGAVIAANAGGATTVQDEFGFGGGSDTGLRAGSTTAAGSIGDSILTAQNQTRANVDVIFPDIADADLINDLTTGGPGSGPVVLDVQTGAGTTTRFTFSQNNPEDTAATEISIGDTLAETLDNAVSTINAFAGSNEENFAFDQFNVSREGNTLSFETLDVDGAVGADGTLVSVAATGNTLGVSATNGGNLDNGSRTGGVNTSDVQNADFIGSIGGFSATFNGSSDQVDASIEVGEFTYNASIADTTPSSDTVVRFESQNGGGAFEVELGAGNGQSVNSQADADTLAQRLDAAFSGLNFSQSRGITSFDGSAPVVDSDGNVTGSLIGASADLQLDDFSSVSIDQIRVNAPAGSNPNASVNFTINGESFSNASPLGDQLGANQTFRFVSENDASRVLEFTTGNTAVSLENADEAAALEGALQEAFGVGNGDAEITFQVGVTSSDQLRIGIGNVSSDAIYQGQDLDVLTQDAALSSADTLDTAIDAVTSVRAEVGAQQSRFNFASANIESSITNQDSARGTLLDTDIAAESTSFATSQVQLQAGISVLAQANQLPQNLLKLIG